LLRLKPRLVIEAAKLFHFRVLAADGPDEVVKGNVVVDVDALLLVVARLEFLVQKLENFLLISVKMLRLS
jgi:hypothetical protein